MKNTFVKVLSMMMALMMIVGAFSMITVSAATCTHENCTETVVDPTCEDAGFTKVVCDCGFESIKDIVPATGKHTWATVPESDPTCTDPAYVAYKECTACGKTEGKYDADGNRIPVKDSKPNGHHYNIPYEQKASCTQDGFTSKKCAVCGDIDKTPKTEANPKGNYVKTADKGHDLVYKVVTPATACLNGTYKVTCKNCDYAKEIYDNDKKHTEVIVTGTTWDRTEVELAGEGKVIVGVGCGAKYEELKYCSVCKTKISAKENKNFGHVSVVFPFGFDMSHTISSTEINEKIIDDTGLKMGDRTFVPQTLNEDGYVLAKCETCNTYFKYVLEKNINHDNGKHTFVENWTDWNYSDHTRNSIRHEYCSWCGLEREVSLNDAKPHNYTLADGKPNQVVIPMSCTSNGFTRHFCTLCSYSYDDAIEYATGHDWTEWTFYAKTTADTKDEGCTSTAADAMVRTCKNKNCSGLFNDTWGETTQKSNKTKHTFEVVTTPATCQKDAFSENVCKDCGFNAGTEGVKQPAAGKNPANHVIKDMQLEYEGSDVDGWLADVQAQSCTEPAICKYACACGEMVIVKTAEPSGHVNIVENAYKKFSDKLIRDFVEKPSDCNTQGQTAGKFCWDCGHVVKAPEAKPLDPKVHDSGSYGILVGTTIPANCTSVAIDRIYWSCCGEIIPTEAGTTKNPNNHPNAVKTAEVLPTCSTTGMKAYYYCADCKKFMPELNGTYDASNAKATLAELDLVTKMLSDKADRVKGQHNWDKATSAIPEQCTVDGKKSYQECLDCDAWLVDGVVVFDDAKTDKVNEQLAAINVPAHGSAYVGNYSYMNGKNNCHEGAYKKIPNTLICEKCGSNGSDGVSFKQEYWVGTTAHAPKTVYVQYTSEDCTVATFAVQLCTICGDEWAIGYNNANVKGEHKFTNDKGEYLHKVGETVAPDCSNPGYSVYKCDNCAETIKVTEKAAIGHHHVVNGVKMPLSFSCADFAANKGLTCVDGCKKTVSEATIEHDRVTSKKDATCTEDGYYVEYCKDCNKTFVATTENKKGHSKDSVLIDVVDGVEKYNCPVCGEYWTKAVVLDLAVNTTFVAGAATVVGGTTTTATVEIAVANGNLTFNVLELVLNTNNKFVAGDVNATATGFATDVEVIADGNKVQIYPANTAETVTITPDAKVSVTFTLTALETANGEVDASVASIFTYTAKATGVEKVKIIPTNKTAAITATMIGNVNGDAMITDGLPVINAADYKATYAYAQQVKVGAAEYDAKYDINRDGEITIADAMAIKTFILSDMNAEDYLTMLGYEFDSLTTDVAGKDFTTLVGKDLVKVIVIDAK